FCPGGPWLKSRGSDAENETPPAGPDGVAWSGICRHRVDDSAHLGYLGRRKSTELGMLLHGRLVFREIDAEALVIDDVGVFPLRLAGQFGQSRIGGCGNILELSAIHSAHAGQIAFDDITFHSPYSMVRVRTGTSLCSRSQARCQY